MSDPDRRRIDAALSITCPVCETPPYQGCVDSGQRVKMHRERMLISKPRLHYAICAECGKEWPCAATHLERNQSRIDEYRRQCERRIERLTADDCLACGQKITPRHRIWEWPGENVWRPDLPARAHLRRQCLDEARRYDVDWAKAWPRKKRGGPGRIRKLACGGALTIHADGTMTCTAEKDGCSIHEVPRLAGRRAPTPVFHAKGVSWCHPEHGYGCSRCLPKPSLSSV